MRFLYLVLSFFVFIFQDPILAEYDIPVLFKGRIRPLSVYSKLWLNETYGSGEIKKEHANKISQNPFTTEELVWKIHFFGIDSLQEVPLFKIDFLNLKNFLKLQPKQSFFSLKELIPLFQNHKIPLEEKKLNENYSYISGLLQQFQNYKGVNLQQENLYQNEFKNLIENKVSKKKIVNILEEKYPLFERLKATGTILKIIPSHYPSGDWFSPHTFKTQVYKMESNSLEPVENFTLFSNNEFEKLRALYLKWEASEFSLSPDAFNHKLHFFEFLYQSYLNLIQENENSSFNSVLKLPTQFKLKLEAYYYEFPLIELAIFLYLLAIFCMFFSIKRTTKSSKIICYSLVLSAFGLHFLILISRSFILGRPPVSNMFETVIYVPIISMLFGLGFYFVKRQTFVLIISCLSALLLLITIKLTNLNSHLENVQPVLNSQFWLIIHVLMIVGSYGLFILAGISGHFYLISYLKEKKENSSMKNVSDFILQSIYLGTGLLISGTILGGIWAAQSWGRFWDWDPKESWAFISSCIYLIWIHAYRFHKISNFGLALGSIVGLLAISFTWYGVNYILGTGFHSYGFGHGGQIYYYFYVLCELLFLSYVIFKRNFKAKLAP